MGQETHRFWGRFALSAPLRRWARALQVPSAIPTRELADMPGQMRKMRDDLDGMAADARTELMARAGTADGIDRPDQCDWAERAGPWRMAVRPRGQVDLGSPCKIGAGATLFHDATQADMSLRQDPAPDSATGAQFGLVLEVYRFDGSFLSLVQDLPQAALTGLTLNHFIAVHLKIDLEQPVEVYARLNVQHGPNTEQMVRQFNIQGDTGVAEFDLAYTKINEKRLEKAWLDLILEGPQMNRIALRDMVLLRAPRADF